MTNEEFMKAEREAIEAVCSKNTKDMYMRLPENGNALYINNDELYTMVDNEGDRLYFTFDSEETAKEYVQYVNCLINLDITYRSIPYYNPNNKFVYITENNIYDMLNYFKYYINFKYKGVLRGYIIRTALGILKNNNKYVIFGRTKDAYDFMNNIYNGNIKDYEIRLENLINSSSLYGICYMDKYDIDIMIGMKKHKLDPYRYMFTMYTDNANKADDGIKYVLYSYSLGNYYFINDKIAAFNNIDDVNKFKESVGVDDTYKDIMVYVPSTSDKYIIIDPNEDTYTDTSKKMQLNNNNVDEYVNIHSYLGTDLNTAEKCRILLKFRYRGIYINYKYKILAFKSDEAADEFIEKSNLKDAPIDKYYVDVSRNDILYLHSDGCFFADADLNELVVPEDKEEEETAKIEGLDAKSVAVNLDYDGITIIPDNNESKKIYIPIECITKFINSSL